MATTKRLLIKLGACLAAFGAAAIAGCFPGEREIAEVPASDTRSICDAGNSRPPPAAPLDPSAACGKWGQICCGQPGAGVCDINNVCLQFDNWCSPRFTMPCTSTSQCGAGLVCEFNHCLSCGVTGYECCADNSCNTKGVTCNSARKCQAPATTP